MFGKGRRLFSIASAALVVAGCLLVAAQLQPSSADLALTALHAAMRAYEVDLGFSPAPIMSLFESFGIGTGVLLIWVGLMNLAVAHHVPVGDRLIRTICTLDIVGGWLLVWVGLMNLAVAHHVPVGDRLIRTICTLDIVGSWVLVGVCVTFDLPTAALSLAVIATLFTVARFRVRLAHPHL